MCVRAMAMAALENVSVLKEVGLEPKIQTQRRANMNRNTGKLLFNNIIITYNT